MKLPILLLLLMTASGLFAQAPIKIPSEITNATVFLEGAQVYRETKATVPAGRQTLVFSGLTTKLDPGSIQVNSTGDDFIVLSVSHRLDYGNTTIEDTMTDPLFRRLDGIAKEEARLHAEVKVAKEEETILKENRVVASTTTSLQAAELRSAVEYHRERLTAINLRYLEINEALEELDEERDAIQANIANLGLQNRTTTTAEIVVVTEAASTSESTFTLAYLVPDAGWVPHYDVRVTDITQPVDLRYRAKVHQATGEDWSDIRLKLSTGDPSVSAIAPTLSTWRVRNGSRPPTFTPLARQNNRLQVRSVRGRVTDEEGLPLIGLTIQISGTQNGTVTDVDGSYQLDLPEEATSLRFSYTGYEEQVLPANTSVLNVVMSESGMLLEEVVVTGYAAGVSADRTARPRRKSRKVSNGSVRSNASAPVPVATVRKATTVNFDIELPYSIPSDGKAREVAIKQHQLPATYTHLAIPKLEEAAYLTASVTDWDKYDLLSGEVNLFFEGTYLGKSALDVSNTNDTLELSLGKDPNVVIERKETDEFKERSFFGNKQRDSRGFTLSVRNKKGQAINLVIKDQVPVSGDEAVEVKVTKNDQAQLDENTGFLTWELSVPASAEWKDSFGYSVKFPKYMRIGLE